MQRISERQGRLLERADWMVERFQNLIDRMAENGKDVSALQAALDSFKAALQGAHPVHANAQGIIDAHQGFDPGGKVIDHDQAVETVKQLEQKLKEVRQLVGEPGKTLRAAIKAFREANRPVDDTSSS